jgi:uncharacterized membrane protein YedE/YeeE
VKTRRYLKPWIFGVLAGSVFVLADVIFPIAPPSAYAFCLSCHVRDLVNTVSNAAFLTKFPATEVAQRALMLTSPGVFLGALIAARANREIRPRKADRPLLFAVLGFLVMTIGIVIFGCPTRITLRAGYGEVYGIVALLGMFGGIAAATVFLRVRSARRETRQ